MTHVCLPEQIARDKRYKTSVHEGDEGGSRCPPEVAPAVFVKFCKVEAQRQQANWRSDGSGWRSCKLEEQGDALVWGSCTVVFLQCRIEAEGCIEDRC